jgi:hypothetical protein
MIIETCLFLQYRIEIPVYYDMTENNVLIYTIAYSGSERVK